MLTDKKGLTAFHLLILVALSVLTVFLFHPFSTEDSYITYRYAQNLVEGHGFVYNQGEKYLGTTAPFYALLLSFFGFLGFSIPTIGGILSAVSLGLTLIILYLLTLRRSYPWVGFFCGLFVLSSPWFLQTFGSETYFQLLMIISAFYFYDRQEYIPTTVFCALAFLVRADGIIPAGIIFLAYLLENRKFPVKEMALFIALCLPLFIFYYLNFNTLLPGTLGVKQAQYASGLWRKFLPGILHFGKLILRQNIFLYFFIPLILIGGVLILFSRKIWFIITSWAILYTLGYGLLKVSFYHWYPIPLIFLFMLMSGFSIQFLTSVPRFFTEEQQKIQKVRILNLDLQLAIEKFKDISSPWKWAYRFLSLIVISSIILVLWGGVKAYRESYESLPFPKLELYTKAGKWLGENIPPEASIAALEVGYLGYHAQRKVIDLVGLVTPGLSDHLRARDFRWVIGRFKPDYFIYNLEFRGWLEDIIEEPWFGRSYEQIHEMSQTGYPHNLKIFKKVSPLTMTVKKSLIPDIIQDESNVTVGEITEETEIGQTFYCKKNDLSRIKVMLATFNRKNHQDVIFHLKYSPSDKEDIYTETFSASQVLDNVYKSFDFPSIPDSQGKMFCFSFESPLSKPGDAITIWATEADRHGQGTLLINGKESQGDLRFRTYCQDDRYQIE